MRGFLALRHLCVGGAAASRRALRGARRKARRPAGIALIAVVLTLIYACFVLCPSDGFVMAVAARTERATVIMAPGPENIWRVDGLTLCVPNDDALFNDSDADTSPVCDCPPGQTVWEPPALFRTLKLAAGTRVIADRKEAGSLMILLEAEQGERPRSVGELQASGRPGAASIAVGPLLYLHDDWDETAQTFGFLGHLVVGAEPQTGADRILVSGRVEAFRRNRFTGARYPVTSTDLDLGDKVVLGGRGHPIPARGFFRIAPDGDEGLVLSAQAETGSARIVRFGEIDDDQGFGYVFSPGWTAQLLADPFGLALAALIYLLASFLTVLAFLIPGQGPDDDAANDPE